MKAESRTTMKILTKNHFKEIEKLLSSTKRSIKIVSPFLSADTANLLIYYRKRGIKIDFITRLYFSDLYDRANNIDALIDMSKSGVDIYALNDLHSKLYIFDDKTCIFGSANFTDAGLKNNIELSILLNNKESEIEEKCVKDLINYFNLIKNNIKSDKKGHPTTKKLKKIRDEYNKTFDSTSLTKKAFRNFTRYGADIKINDDIKKSITSVKNEIKNYKEDIFNSYTKNFSKTNLKSDNHKIWLKFGGRANSRADSDIIINKPANVILKGRKVYVTCYSKNKKPHCKEGDYYYTAHLTTDRNNNSCPIIHGRGKFTGEKGTVKKEWVKRYPWMQEYPNYCVVDNLEYIKTKLINGIILSELWKKFGSDTYETSYGRNESFDKVKIKHYEKNHIKLSKKAQSYIDKKLGDLFKKYGKIRFYCD